MKFEHGQRPYIIAEIGANHNGDVDLAKKMIDTAKNLGCDAVKFQSWDTDLFAQVVYDENHFLQDDYRNRQDHTLKSIVEEFRTTPEELTELATYCRQLGIDFLSTPFSSAQVDHLVALGAPFLKIASMDLVNDPLLRHAARTGLPIMLSTGLSSLAEIEHAIETVEAEGNKQIILLHCISIYPPADEDVHLNVMDTLRQAFGYPVGFSDHTLGTDIPIASVVKGAVAIEKHFTLDKDMFGWDHKISADAAEMGAIVKGAHKVWAALGNPRKVVSEAEMKKRAAFRRSVISARAIKAGEVIGEGDLTFKRPGTGIAPNIAPMLIGMVAARDIPHDKVLTFQDLQMNGSGVK